MMCTTVLHGGVCRRTSTPHKSGNKMKEKKKKKKKKVVTMKIVTMYNLLSHQHAVGL